MKSIDYKILGDHDSGALTRQVLAAILEGWQPFGSLQVVAPVVDEAAAPCHYQAMVMYGK